MLADRDLADFQDRYSVVNTTCPFEMSEIIERTFTPYQSNFSCPARNFDASLAVAKFADMGLHILRNNHEAFELIRSEQGTYAFCVTLCGCIQLTDVEHGCLEFPPSSARLFRRREGMRIAVTDRTTTICLSFPASLVQNRARSMFALDQQLPVAFDPQIDITEGAGLAITLALRHMVDLLLHLQQPCEHKLLAANLQDYISSYIVGAMPSNYSRAAEELSSNAPPCNVRRAEKYIQDCASLPISLADIADATGCSERGLQTAFRQHRHTTPMRYLRDVRLDEARKDLQTHSASVADTALKWGFSGFGRFANYYQERFGEYPSETLRAARNQPL